MKKTISFLSTLLILSVIFVSCDAISGIDLTDQNSVDKKLRAKIEKHVDPQASVFEVSLGTTADFSTDMNIITVVFLAPGADEVKQLNITVQGNQEPREVKVLSSRMKERTAETGIKLSDLDFSKIAANVHKAAEMLPELEKEYEGVKDLKLDGIKNYRMSFDANPEKIKHNFDIRCTQGTEFGTDHGRAATITNYIEFFFEADAEGNVTFIE